MERAYAGEEQRKKGEKKEGERRDKTKKWGKIEKVQRAENKKREELRDRRKSCREEGLLEKKKNPAC